jgi:hypothetical protein
MGIHKNGKLEKISFTFLYGISPFTEIIIVK